MSQAKLLEEFRQNDYLREYMLILSLPGKDIVEMTYNNYSIQAFYSLSNDLNDLENEKNFINNGRSTVPSIALWFLTMESYVNCLCKIVSLINKISPRDIIQKNIAERISFLVEAMCFDKEEIRKSKIYNKVNEFRDVRNELFHDRNTGKGISIKHTKFSNTPFLSNQVDTFQSLLITLEVITLFRFSLPGVDLMPNISIGNGKVLHFEKLDQLYIRYLRPYFEEILKKHQLATGLNLEISNFKSQNACEFFHFGEFAPISRIEEDLRFKYELNQTQTTVGRDIYYAIVDEYNLPDRHISGLNFVIDWPTLYKAQSSIHPR